MKFLGGLVVLTWLVPVAFAQTTTAVLKGTVTDTTGSVLPDTTVEVSGPTGRRTTVSDNVGVYYLARLTPGSYTVTVSRSGFQTQAIGNIDLSLDRTITLDIQLDVAQAEQLTVRPDTPAHDRSRSSFSSIIGSDTIDIMPVNERNYLDLVRLTPGVVVNPVAVTTAASDQDTSGAILGERAGNASFLIDGLWNNDGFQGGALQNLTQDSVHQFEVIATGYAAEFGQGSGGVVNVITKSGTNQVSGNGFLFTRNDALDASNVDGEAPPELSRYDMGVTIGGPVERDRAWYFGSFEHISEDRESLFPEDIPAELAAQEDFSQQPETRDDRLFGKYTRRFSLQHQMQTQGAWERLDQQNRLQSGSALPSASEDLRDNTYLASVSLISQLSSSGVFEAMFGARGQSLEGTADGDTRSFSAAFLDLGRSFQFGPPIGSVRTLDQRYYTGRGSLTWFAGSGHTLKGGGEYLRTSINGENEASITHVLVTTRPNFALYGRDGFQIPQGVGFATPADSLTRIRNNGGALFLQDDWQLSSNLTVNLGVRYDFDSVFDDANNVAPRLGLAWVPEERTVVRASWGIFYDRYRLGIAHAVPQLGGFNGRTFAEADYPRLLADALPFGNGALAFLAIIQRDPFVLHRMFGIPTDAVVTQDNVSTLTGLSPEAFLGQLNGVLTSTGIPVPAGRLLPIYRVLAPGPDRSVARPDPGR